MEKHGKKFDMSWDIIFYVIWRVKEVISISRLDITYKDACFGVQVKFMRLCKEKPIKT